MDFNVKNIIRVKLLFINKILIFTICLKRFLDYNLSNSKIKLFTIQFDFK